MTKKELAKRYISLFEKLINEKDKESQLKIAKDIANYSTQINDDVQENYSDTVLQEIQEACLPMEHWKDGTGYCDLNETDIKRFMNRLKEFI